ncbi:dihydrodipicolinate synthase family protein [Flavilitoribacter nigricans]|uniref:Dihydrodipicolinate synthase family protein n=1 Tax=Flavilitoribacter nigricans (strain ATCC 23147 / DSM 23189 / NBRC 102662 / NCIMB 1420 / SS-2) TaxID=1122177 RepID=A0A2D0N9E8_FLAN2|nr:dihydrodipicolinate synthase family protein [Flavilitoribacter nigricans]PHN04996.1 dihydrodipicolinate synthase family protein [Flavilitoribacter nigricans DSM 23189 = NBRC 102662]
MKVQWNGVYPALTTKFTADDQLDLDLFAHNLEAQLSGGVEGIILGGTLGESSVLEVDEKERLVKFAIEQVAGRVPVVLNIAEGSTREALKQAELGEKWGADGLMILPPMRYKSDHRETVTYFKTVANSTSLPMMIYNNPVDYKILVTLDMFEELTECDNIQAIKESTRDVSNVTRLINRFGDRYKILCGVDTLAMEELCLGAHGWVAGLVCAFPAETVAVYKLVKAGRLEEARQLYRWFLPLLELDIHPKLVQYIKLAEAEVGIGSEQVRPPRLPLIGAERERVLGTIREGLANRPELPELDAVAAH